MTPKQHRLAQELLEMNVEDPFIHNILIEDRRLNEEEEFKLKKLYDKYLGYGREQ